jgi:hypothetical protein
MNFYCIKIIIFLNVRVIFLINFETIYWKGILIRIFLGSRTISNSSLVLPRPPEDLPLRGLFDSFGGSKDNKEAAVHGVGGLPDLNIGE